MVAPLTPILLLVLQGLAQAASAECPFGERTLLRERCSARATRLGYRRCVQRELKAHAAACRAEMARCELRLSTVRRSKATICCMRDRKGRSFARILRDPARCRPRRAGESACVADPAFASACDACEQDGSCETNVAGRWLCSGLEGISCQGALCGGVWQKSFVSFVVNVVQEGSAVEVAYGPKLMGTVDEATGSIRASAAHIPESPHSGSRFDEFSATDIRDGHGSCARGVTEGSGVKLLSYHGMTGEFWRLTGSCGDGLISDAERCDPDGLSALCPEGETCSPTCECESKCGDLLVGPSETCDASATPNGCSGELVCEECQECRLTASNATN